MSAATPTKRPTSLPYASHGEKKVSRPQPRGRNPRRVLGRRGRLVLAPVEVRAWTGQELPGPAVAAEARAAALGVVHDGLPRRPDHANQDVVALAGRLDTVVAAAQVHLHLGRLLRVERPVEDGLACPASVGPERPGAHVRVAAAPLDLDLLRGIAQADLDLLREVLVVGLRPAAQPVAAALEVLGQARRVELDVLRRLPPQRLVDHRVGDPRLQLGGGVLVRLSARGRRAAGGPARGRSR